ncbi:MAG: hypothetical protein ABSF08_08495 [Candidatus Cybelea sp.]
MTGDATLYAAADLAFSLEMSQLCSRCKHIALTQLLDKLSFGDLI